MPVAKRRDPDCGSPFLLLTLLLAKQKKSESPAAATERHQNYAKSMLAQLAKEIRMRAFWGSEHKFPEPSARPAGASLCAQRNCDPTPKTRRLALHASLSSGDWTYSTPALNAFQSSSPGKTCASSYAIHSNPRNRSTILRAYRLATSPTNFGKSTCALSSARSEIVRTDANGKP